MIWVKVERPRPGRPIKDDARRARINIRLRDDEHQMIADVARMVGKTRTDVIIDAVRMYRDFIGG